MDLIKSISKHSEKDKNESKYFSFEKYNRELNKIYKNIKKLKRLKSEQAKEEVHNQIKLLTYHVSDIIALYMKNLNSIASETSNSLSDLLNEINILCDKISSLVFNILYLFSILYNLKIIHILISVLETNEEISAMTETKKVEEFNFIGLYARKIASKVNNSQELEITFNGIDPNYKITYLNLFIMYSSEKGIKSISKLSSKIIGNNFNLEIYSVNKKDFEIAFGIKKHNKIIAIGKICFSLNKEIIVTLTTPEQPINKESINEQINKLSRNYKLKTIISFSH